MDGSIFGSFEGVAHTYLARRGRSHFLLTWGREKEDGKM